MRNLRRPAAGWLLTAALAAAVLHAFAATVPIWPAALAGWFAGLLLWPDVTARTRLQVSMLLVAGTVTLGWGALHGVEPDWQRALSSNTLLIAMLTAVGFLRLISTPKLESEEQLPRGPRAVASTLLGLHLFGAVINLSTLFIVAERIRRSAPLGKQQFRLLTCGYSAAALWSPFFAGMAATLTF